MDDYTRYLNAIQSAGFADNVVDLQSETQDQKQEALQPLGEMLTTGSLGHVASAVVDKVKSIAMDKAKDVARQALKKAGVNDSDAEELLKGNFDSVAKAKVQNLIDKVKGKVDEVKSSVEDKVDELKTKAQDTFDEAKTTAQDAMDEAQSTVENAVSDIQSSVTQGVSDLDVVDGSNISGLANEMADNAANEGSGILSRISNFEPEFGDNDLLQVPRMLQQSGGIRPQPTEAPMIEDGTEMTDLSGYVNQAQSLAENAVSQAGEFADSALSTATTTAESIAPAISDAVGAASSALSGAASSITEAASGITSAASNAVSGISSAISGAAAGDAAADAIGTAVGSTVLESVSSFLGPLGIFAAIGGGIASLVEGLAPHDAPPVLNPSAQFL